MPLVIKGILLLLVFSITLWVGFIFHRKTWAETYLFGQVFLCGMTDNYVKQIAEEIESDELQRGHMYVQSYQDECEVVP